MKVETIKVGSLNTNCYLLHSKKEGLVIDPGDEPEKIIKRIRDSNTNFQHLINTHGHYDHIGGNEKLSSKCGIKIINSDEVSDLKVGEVTLEVLETPGHKNDAVCLIGEKFAFTGDTIFKNEHGRVDLSEGSIKKMKETLEKLSRNLEPGMKIYPGHGEAFELKTTKLKKKYL